MTTLAYFPKQTPNQSETVWKAFLTGSQTVGLQTVENSLNADAAVIWSVLWHGKMLQNKMVYDHYRKRNKPVFIIEVGALRRGITWKISVNHITRVGVYPNTFTKNRDKLLNIQLQTLSNSKDEFLIACQHAKSLQWEGQPDMREWAQNKVNEIRTISDKPIVVRPHPRYPFQPFTAKDVRFETPIKLPDSYDVYNIMYNYYAVINHNSGPSIQAGLAGAPIICDSSSLAYPISSTLESPQIKDREAWFQDLLHTEWTVEEIASGTVIKNLLDKL